MDFTREPIIETVVTPKEGCKLVVRSSKSSGQEEYFVDAVEVVSFGNSFFFRSLERPKAFLVPASDYEILEVRETRMVLKNVGLDRSIKIGGGREGSPPRQAREPAAEKPEPVYAEEAAGEPVEAAPASAEAKPDGRIDKKRDRRRNYRRRRGREDVPAGEPGATDTQAEGSEVSPEKIDLPPPKPFSEGAEGQENVQPMTSILSTLLPPPPNLISETIARYKDNALFKGAFFLKDDQPEVEAKDAEEVKEEKAFAEEEDNDVLPVKLAQPEYGSFEMTEEEHEEIYRQRKSKRDEVYSPEATVNEAEEHISSTTQTSEDGSEQEEDNRENPQV